LTDRPIRVLHCPEVVGGHAPQLARAERALGVQARSIALQPSPYQYAADEILTRPGDRFLAFERKRFQLLRRACRDFDVVHFNFGSSLFPGPGHHPPRPGTAPSFRQRLARLYHVSLFMRDVPFLKKAGKAIFVTYQGDDARQGDYCRTHFPLHFVHEVGAGYYPDGSDERKRAAIARFAAYADGIYALNPDLLYVLPDRARFLPYANVDPGEWTPVPPAGTGPLKVVHAPSHRGVKGTHYIVDAVSRLKADGIAIELELVENLTWQNARQAYARADVAVDQLLAGWYGGFGVEAMALGKPLVAYLREPDLQFLPGSMRVDLPVINADPRTIHDVLKSLASMERSELVRLGMRGRAYVERWHHPAKIAAALICDYERALSRPCG
jgi:glycosyltransferase involved in cell wall biosynthesis